MATNDRLPTDMIEDRVTKKKLNTTISEINTTLTEKVNKTSVIADINSSAETAKILADNLSLNGLNVSGQLVVDTSGNVTFSGTLTSTGVTTTNFLITGKSETTIEHKTPITITKEIKSRDNTNSVLTVTDGVVKFNHNAVQYWYSDKDVSGWTRFKIGDVFLKTNGTNIMEVRNNSDDGMATVKALAFEVVSDKDLKENIEDLNINVIEIMKNQMKVKEYNFSGEPDGAVKSIGLIAQETTDLISNGVSVNLYAHNSLNTMAIQELITRLEIVENRLSVLENIEAQK